MEHVIIRTEASMIYLQSQDKEMFFRETLVEISLV